MVFRHSWKDSGLVAIALLHLGLLVVGGVWYEHVPWPAMVGLGAVLVFLYCTNYQCVAHNFLHNPFFRFNPLNGLFSLINSAALGMPQTLYKYHHLNHHMFNNDPLDDTRQTTGDWSSTYRHARRPPREESIITYALLGPLRTDLVGLYRVAKAKRRAPLVWAEVAFCALFVGGLAIWKPWYTLQFVLPVWYLGQAAALAENYLEHHRARPGNRLTDSVSCYNWLYNLIWFNNGYHQEHHYRPTVHWTEVPKLRTQMVPETERRVVRWAHWFNW